MGQGKSNFKAIQVTVVALLLAMLATPGFAAIVAISTANPSAINHTDGPTHGLAPNDVGQFDSVNRFAASTSTLLMTGTNVNAFYISENGNFLYSGSSGTATFPFQAYEIVEYDTATNITTSFFDMSVLTTTGVTNIDAFFIRDNGNYVFSNRNAFTIDGIAYSRNDLIEIDPSDNSVSLFFDGALIAGGDQFNNLSSASMFDANTLALSVLTGGTPDVLLGGLAFQRNDMILYNMITGVATLGFDGTVVFGAPGAGTLDALHIIGPPVPIPAAFWLLFSGLGLLGWRSRSASRV